MTYKVVIDATKALDKLNEMGINESVVKENYLFVDANNPDGACHAAIEKLMDQIIKEKLSDEIVDFLDDELSYNIKITALTKVKPYA